MKQPDSIAAPNVENVLRVGNFQLHIYAYKKLSFVECQTVGAQWLKSKKRKKFPTSGNEKVFTTIGFDNQ